MINVNDIPDLHQEFNALWNLTKKYYICPWEQIDEMMAEIRSLYANSRYEIIRQGALGLVNDIEILNKEDWTMRDLEAMNKNNGGNRDGL